jgi:hypothetical protein
MDSFNTNWDIFNNAFDNIIGRRYHDISFESVYRAVYILCIRDDYLELFNKRLEQLIDNNRCKLTNKAIEILNSILVYYIYVSSVKISKVRDIEILI